MIRCGRERLGMWVDPGEVPGTASVLSEECLNLLLSGDFFTRASVF